MALAPVSLQPGFTRLSIWKGYPITARNHWTTTVRRSASLYAGTSRRILLNISLIVLTLLLIVSLFEVILRSLVPASNVSLFEFTTTTPRFKVMKPNIHGLVYGVPIETNNVGFRDNKPWTNDKDTDEFRIIVLGDSFTVSAGVAFHSIYTQVLQSVLQIGFPERRLWVMNLGVAGYNMMQYLYVLQEVGLGLKPDYIIVGVFPSNDFENTTFQQMKEVALGLQAPPRDEGIRSFHFYKAFGWKFEYLAGRIVNSMTLSPQEPKPKFGPGSDGWEDNASALISLARTSEKNEIPFLAILLPEPSNFRVQKPRHDIVKQFCIANGIECVDMLDEFITTGLSARRFSVNLIDAHPNAEYNRIVGHTLGNYLATRVGLPGNPEAKEVGVVP
jgi:hypothetical protein